MITPEQNDRIAQWLGLWEPGKKCDGPFDYIGWGPSGALCEHDRSRPHEIESPDLRTGENLAKVKAALMARGYTIRMIMAHRVFCAVWKSDDDISKASADTEAEALLAAIWKLMEGDDE